MNLLLVLSKLDEDDLCSFRCWLWAEASEKDPDTTWYPYHLKTPTDFAFLSKEQLRRGARAWIKKHHLPPKLTHCLNVTAGTARKIFGEDS